VIKEIKKIKIFFNGTYIPPKYRLKAVFWWGIRQDG